MTEPTLSITGGRKLSGKVSIAGSSNQVTKCIVASMLTEEPVLIKGAPEVNERYALEELFLHLGGKIDHISSHDVKLYPKEICKSEVPQDIASKNRIAILTAGPLLHRFRQARIFANLGGDQLGKRPVDFHIRGLMEMGARIELVENVYHMSVGPEGLKGAHIVMPFPSVMATENLIIAATLAKGRTIIENAAIEPEVNELVKMLQKMGADIMTSANRTYIIQGVPKLRGCELRIMPDRNQAVSFACAALATGGEVLLDKFPHDALYSYLNFIQRMGAEFRVNSEGILVKAPVNGRLSGVHIEVDVHPGFMTDWQQPFMVLFTQAQGASVLHETVFDDRLGYTEYLNKMGANITPYTSCLGELPCRFRNKNSRHSAIVMGPTPLKAHDFALPTDIRAGMCLVIAALVAEGTSHFTRIEELQRKYDHLSAKLQAMGADVIETGGKTP